MGGHYKGHGELPLTLLNNYFSIPTPPTSMMITRKITSNSKGWVNERGKNIIDFTYFNFEPLKSPLRYFLPFMPY